MIKSFLSSWMTDVWDACTMLISHSLSSCCMFCHTQLGISLYNINTYFDSRSGCFCSIILSISPHTCTGISKAFNVSLTVIKKTHVPYIILPMSVSIKARRIKAITKLRTGHYSSLYTNTFIYNIVGLLRSWRIVLTGFRGLKSIWRPYKAQCSFYDEGK